VDKETAWSEVITRLGTIAGINKVYEGFKDLDTIPTTYQPCVMVEPDSSEPLEDDYDNTGGNYAYENVSLVVWVLFTMFEKGKAVTGKVGMNGVFEWEKAVKDKLTEAPQFLNDKVIRVSFGNVRYLRNVSESADKGILRLVEIEVNLRLVYST